MLQLEEGKAYRRKSDRVKVKAWVEHTTGGFVGILFEDGIYWKMYSNGKFLLSGTLLNHDTIEEVIPLPYDSLMDIVKEFILYVDCGDWPADFAENICKIIPCNHCQDHKDAIIKFFEDNYNKGEAKN